MANKRAMDMRHDKGLLRLYHTSAADVNLCLATLAQAADTFRSAVQTVKGKMNPEIWRDKALI